MKDVAQHASVSLATVSKYLNSPQRVAPKTQARIQYAIEELGYVRNEAARQLKSGKSRMVALVAMELNNQFFSEVAEAMAIYAAKQNLFLSILCAGGDAKRETEYLHLLVQQRVYGVVLASGLTGLPELELLHRTGTPAVLMDAYEATPGFSSCSINDFSGGYQATQHLIEQGCRRIAFIGGAPEPRQIREREKGAAQAVAAHPGVTLEIIGTKDRSVAEGIKAGWGIAKRPVSERPDGVFAANDSLAIGIIEALSRQADIAVPADIAVIGYDDVDFAGVSAVGLSSVRRPRRFFGRSVIEMLQEQAEGTGTVPGQHLVIDPKLVVRASSLRDSD